MRASLVELLKEYERLPLANRRMYPADGFVPDLASTMFVEAITWWLEQERPYTPEDMAKRCALLVTAIFQETSTWQ